MSSQSDKILELIAVSGELPAAALRHLPIKDSYRYRLIADLKAQKLIRVYSRDGAKAYKLTANAKEVLLERNLERFEFFLSGNAETSKRHTDIKRRYRLHRTAEVIVTLANTGIAYFPDKKAALFCEPHTVAPQSSEASFYFSREMKSIGQEHMKIRSSRAIGVIISEDKIMLVYNTGSNIMKWEHQAEVRCKALLTNRFNQNAVSGLMTGKSMDIALAMLNSADKKQTKYFGLGKTFDTMYFVPNTSEGETQLRILCSTEARSGLRELLLSDLASENPQLPLENDAIDKNGLPVLLAHEFDMERIRRFRKSLELFDMRGVVYCFDFQQSVLSEYFGSLAKFQTISLEKVKNSGVIRCF